MLGTTFEPVLAKQPDLVHVAYTVHPVQSTELLYAHLSFFYLHSVKCIALTTLSTSFEVRNSLRLITFPDTAVASRAGKLYVHGNVGNISVETLREYKSNKARQNNALYDSMQTYVFPAPLAL